MFLGQWARRDMINITDNTIIVIFDTEIQSNRQDLGDNVCH